MASANSAHGAWLAERMYELCCEDQCTDFTLHVGIESVKCHSAVVAACSQELRDACRKGDTEKWLNIEVTQRQCLTTLLDVRKFMYLGLVSVRENNVASLLGASKSAGLTKLTELCEQFMLDNLNVHNGRVYESLAQLFQLWPLVRRCEQLKKERFVDVIRTPWFQNMSTEEAHSYLHAWDLRTGGEDNLLLALNLWLQSNPTTETAGCERIFTCVRISKCSPRVMRDIIADSHTCEWLRNKLRNALPDPPPPIPPTSHPPSLPPPPPTHPPPAEPTLVVVGGRKDKNNRHAGILRCTPPAWYLIGRSRICSTCDFYSVATDAQSLIISGGVCVARDEPSHAVMRYCVNTLQWTKLSRLPRSRVRHGSACVASKLCVFGGQLPASDEMISAVDILDLQRGIWYQGRDMPQPVNHAGVAVSESDIIVVGGDVGSTLTNRTQLYNVTRNEWKVCADMPVAREYAAHSTVALHRVVYVLAGPDFLHFNISTNQWSYLRRPDRPMLWGAMVLQDGKLKAMGGLDEEEVTERRIQTYDILQMTWQEERDQLSIPLAYHAAFVLR